MPQLEADLITTLVAKDLELSPGAWEVHPNARALVIQGGDWTTQAAIHNIIPQLLSLLHQLPSQRVDSIRIELWRNYCYGPGSLAFASDFIQTPISNTLESLDLRITISTAAADVLLQGLPSLKHAYLRVVSNDGSLWRPAIAPGLVSFHLEYASRIKSIIDVCDLAAAADTLRELEIRAVGNSDIRSSDRLYKLRALEQLVVAGCWQGAEADVIDWWSLTSQLPALQQAEVPNVVLPLSLEQPQLQQPETGLTSLKTAAVRISQQPAAAGGLQQVLPALRELSAHSGDIPLLLPALSGHSSISSLHLTLDCRAGAQAWPAPHLLQSLPALTHFQATLTHQEGHRGKAAVEAILQDAAQCEALQQLHLVAPGGITVRSMQLLAAGRCTRLQHLQLHSSNVSLSALAALLVTNPQAGLRQVLLSCTSHAPASTAVHQDRRDLLDAVSSARSLAADARLVRMAWAFAGSRGLAEAMAVAVAEVLGGGQAAGEGSLRRNLRAQNDQIMGDLEGRLLCAGGEQQQQQEEEGVLAAMLQQVQQGLVLRARVAEMLSGRLTELCGRSVVVRYRGCCVEMKY